MKEKLIAYFNRKLHQIDTYPVGGRNFFAQAFGALEFACETINNRDEENELIDLWNEEWKPKFEAKIWGE